ncbi:MAG: SpoIIE family protein phosphatase [Clostridia bacterium]|nr:SpoIIE family protein phosphatase [Clostridia bacterium]MDD4685954.1 SpoIIE family protein phosphatase [Clostridia bacterium]
MIKKSSAFNKHLLEFLKYFCFFLCFFILSNAGIYEMFYPFAVGFLFALIWCNQKLQYLAPLYILACFINNFTVFNIVSVIFTVTLILIICLTHTKLKKQIKLILFCVYFIFSQSAYIFIQIYFYSSVLVPILTIFLGVLFMLSCIQIFQVVLVRGLVYRLNALEIISALVVLCSISCGLYTFNIYGFEVVKLFAVLAILLSSYIFNITGCLLVGSVIGLSGLISSGSSELIAPLVIWALVISIFKTNNRLLPVITLLSTEIVLGYFVNIYYSYNYLSFLSVTLGCLIFLCVNSSYLNKVADFFNVNQGNMAMRNVVNRSRENLCKRLYDLSEVFGEMDYVFRSMIKGGMSKEQVKNLLITDVRDKVCIDCSEKNMCHRMCSSETSGVFESLIASALERGKTTLLDIPPYLTTRCSRVNNLVGVINQLCSQYRQYAGVMNNMDASRVLIAEQLFGVSQIMKNLAGEVRRNVSLDYNRENAIINELSYNNIICSDAVLYEQNVDVVSASLVVRKEDSTKLKIPFVVSKICKNKMIVTSQEPSIKAGWNVLSLQTAPKYDVIFGTASCPKDGSKISGDCYSVIRIDNDKYLLALCDGMGSGEKAEKASSLAIGLVENFYKAGFDNDIILSSINKLLSLNKEDVFSALDVCVVNIRQGTSDFIKMGAPNSYIKHLNTTDVVMGGALPLGIVQDMQPIIIKQVLSAGDLLFLFTDGISESFAKEEDLCDYINNLTGLNPQILAEQFINKAIELNNGARDDMTVIVAKIFDI